MQKTVFTTRDEGIVLLVLFRNIILILLLSIFLIQCTVFQIPNTNITTTVYYHENNVYLYVPPYSNKSHRIGRELVILILFRCIICNILILLLSIFLTSEVDPDVSGVYRTQTLDRFPNH